MPRVRGIEFIENYFNFEENKRIEKKTPFIILSANVTGEEISKAIELGVRNVVTKPCTAEDFIQKVSEVLRKYKREKIKILKGESEDD